VFGCAAAAWTGAARRPAAVRSGCPGRRGVERGDAVVGRRLRRVLRRTDRKIARADTPERLVEAFEWFRQQIGELHAAELRKKGRDRPVLP